MHTVFLNDRLFNNIPRSKSNEPQESKADKVDTKSMRRLKREVQQDVMTLENGYKGSYLLLILALVLLLVGCSNSRQVVIEVQAADYLNPDVQGQAEPVVVMLYELKSDFNFQQATYDQLVSNASSVLGNDLIDRHWLEIRPHSTQTINQILSPNTQFLGWVASYRNIGQASWRQIIPVRNAQNSETEISVNLESESLTVKLEPSSSIKDWL